MRILFTIICVLSLSSIQAQTKQTKPVSTLKTTSINEGTIADKFEFVAKKSSNYRDEKGRPYEVVKRTMLESLRVQTLDSLTSAYKKHESSNLIIANQKKEIESLKSQLSTTNDNLAQLNNEKDSMPFFGMLLSKASYNSLMWGIIAALFILLIVFIYKFNNAIKVTKAAKISLLETEEEYEQHRRNALEREQKVRRQLQDLINKQKGV